MASYNITLEDNSVSPTAIGTKFQVARASGDPGLTVLSVPGVLLNGVDANSIPVSDNQISQFIKVHENTWVGTAQTPYYIVKSDSSASQSIANNTVTAVTIYNSVLSNSGNITFASSIATVKETAVYDLCANFSYPANITGMRQVWFGVNGSSTPQYGVCNVAAIIGGIPTRLNATARLNLNENDTVQVYTYQTSGGNLSCGGLNVDPDQQIFSVVKVA
jgi:hypothetical protein